MHKVLEKIKLRGFTGDFNVHGTEREVMYSPGDNGEPSVFAIAGLSVEDALHILDRLDGGLLKGKDAENPPKVEKTTNTKVAEQVKASAPPKEEKKAAPPPKEPEPEDDDLGDDDAAVDTTGLDVGEMAKFDKLRQAIEYMIANGIKTVDEIVNQAAVLIDKVPVFKSLKEKGGDFDKRMERAALVVMGGDQVH